MSELPFNIINLPPNTLPEGTAIIGDFAEIDRAAREKRPINPKAFMVLKDVGEPAPPEPERVPTVEEAYERGVAESSVNPELTDQPERYIAVRLPSSMVGAECLVCIRCGVLLPDLILVGIASYQRLRTAKEAHDRFHDLIDALLAEGDGCE